MGSRTSVALRIGIVCHAWFCFGFLYEEIVDVPNMIGVRAAEAQALWDPYHWLTNPVFYYALIALPAPASLAYLWLKRAGLSPANQARLRVAIGGHLAMGILTMIAVTQINNIIYFGPPIGDPARVRLLASTWFVLNAARILATAVTTTKLVSIFLTLHDEAVRATVPAVPADGVGEGIRR